MLANKSSVKLTNVAVGKYGVAIGSIPTLNLMLLYPFKCCHWWLNQHIIWCCLILTKVLAYLPKATLLYPTPPNSKKVLA